MSRFDLILRNGTLVTPARPALADIAVLDGAIAEIGPEIEGSAAEEIDAGGMHILPGGIDAHVHINEPGRTEWEGWATGTAALAVGGMTSCLEMPLNANPPTLDAATWDAKVAAATGHARVDFALWGGLTPINLGTLDELADRGAIGFKAFMSRSGTPDFPHADDATLHAGMTVAARRRMMVAVHAESDELTAQLAQEAIAAGRRGVRDYLASRPVAAETEAIARAIAIAAETGSALHIVHVSSGAGVALVAEARAKGQDVTCETCAHYLVFTGDDVERIGAAAKCAPPIRDAVERDALWSLTANGAIDMVTSDHSPAPASMKTGDDFFAIWGGIAGAQSTLDLMLSAGYADRGLPLARIADLLAGAVARRFRLPDKGRIAVGADADLALVDLARRWTLTHDALRDRHRLSPYVGMPFTGKVVRTILRGQTIAIDGDVVGPATGRLLTPSPAVLP